MSGPIQTTTGGEAGVVDLKVRRDGRRWSITPESDVARTLLREHLRSLDASRTGQSFVIDAALASQVVTKARRASLTVAYSGPNEVYRF